MRRSPLLVLIAALILYEALSIEVICTSFSVARISQIDNPTEVAKGRKFTIQVTCEYTSQVLADVGIFETDSSRVLDSVTLISQSVGPGNVTFTFTLKAPLVEGNWNLVATTRAWWADSWFSDPVEGSRHFQVRVTNEDHVSVKLESLLSFEFDGIRHNGVDAVTLRVNRGIHQLRAEATKEIQQGVRLVFDRWSDGVRSNPRSLILTSDLSLTAQYRKEYRLTIYRSARTLSTDEWYDANSYADFGTPPDVPIDGLPAEFGFRSIFDHWEGDVNSNSVPVSLKMDEPKTITEVRRAAWVPSLATSSLFALASVFLICSALILFRSGSKKGPQGTSRRSSNRLKALGFVLVIVLLTLSSSRVEATSDPLVQTGLASWRHWGNTASSTCLIWIGGGVLGQNVVINPYWLESFNTMRYVQELGESYGVLTLEHGAGKVSQPQLNRTIDGEPYPGQSLQQARRWAHSVGYRYVFLVGYSVGGIAALTEVTSADPEGWGSPDGVVLVTVPIAQSLSDPGRLRANLLLLYGEKMDEIYTQSGRRFYAETKDEGGIDGAWFHKEIHVLENVAHEVWTIADTGSYDTRASFLTVSFIERSKSLQLGNEKSLTMPALDKGRGIGQLDIRAPKRVRTNSQFRIEVQVAQLVANQTVDIVVYDEFEREAISLETFRIEANPIRASMTVCPTGKPRVMRLSVLALTRGEVNGETKTLAQARLEIDVTNEVNVMILSTRSRATLKVDGAPSQLDPSGAARFNVTIGSHSLEVSQAIEVGEGVLDVFESWSDGVRSPRRMITVTDDLKLQALYKRLYRVDAASRFGVVQGAGWYEANSSAVISVTPTVVRGSNGERDAWYVFSGWRDEGLSESRIVVYVDSPTTYTAQWRAYSKSETPTLASVAAISGSLILLIVVLTKFNARRRS